MATIQTFGDYVAGRTARAAVATDTIAARGQDGAVVKLAVGDIATARANSLAAFASVALAAASTFSVLEVPAQAYTINAPVDLGQKVFLVQSGGSFTGSSSAEPSGYTWGSGTRFGLSLRNTSRDSYQQYLALNVNPLSSFDLMQTVMTVDSTSTVEHLCGFASYIRNRMPAAGIGRNTVGFFGLGTAEVDGSIWWGINTLFQDSATRATHSGTGRLGIGAELDFNVTGTNTQIIGISLGGNSLAQPAQANAYIANSLSGASPGSVARWTTGFWVPDACATNGLALGATATSGNNISSIPILLQYFNGSGVKKTLTIRSATNALQIFNDDSFCQLQTDALSLTGNAVIGGVAIVPTVIGGGSASSSLTLQATFGAGAGSERVFIKGGNNGAQTWAEFGPMGERNGARVLFRLLNADMNSTADQAFEKIGTFTKWAAAGNGSITVELVSGSCSSAVGGIYTAASKGGQDILIATQAYSGLTLVGGAIQLTVSKAGGRDIDEGTLFLSLTTANGSAGRCNIYIIGVPLD